MRPRHLPPDRHGHGLRLHRLHGISDWAARWDRDDDVWPAKRHSTGRGADQPIHEHTDLRRNLGWGNRHLSHHIFGRTTLFGPFLGSRSVPEKKSDTPRPLVRYYRLTFAAPSG